MPDTSESFPDNRTHRSCVIERSQGFVPVAMFEKVATFSDQAFRLALLGRRDLHSVHGFGDGA